MMASVRSVIVLGLAAAWLGGCAVGGFDLGGSSSSTPPDPAPTRSAIVPAVPPDPVVQAPPPPAVQTAAQPVTAQASRQAPAGRAMRAAAPAAATPSIAAEEEVPQEMTVTRARELCWMETEGAKPIRDIDKKIKYVEKCVTDKLRSAGH